MINFKKKHLSTIENWYIQIVLEELNSYFFKVGNSKVSYLALVNMWSRAHLGLEYKEVITLSHNEIKGKIATLVTRKSVPSIYVKELIKTYGKFSKASSGIGDNNHSALDLVEKLITRPYSCPLCNSVRLVVRKSKNGELDYRECEFDHFFSKSKFPIFALSLYNLVPSCHSCNHVKSSKILTCSPYDSKDISKFTEFVHLPLDIDQSEYRLCVNFYHDMCGNNAALKLEGKYDAYNEDLNNLLRKVKKINNLRGKKWLERTYGDLKVGIEEYFDFKSDSKKYVEKEFSKMKSDILNFFFKEELK